MAGNIPFDQYSNWTVITKIMSGIRPERPMGTVMKSFPDVLWRIVEDCWKQHSKERSIIHVVLNQLSKITQYWVPPNPVAVDSQLEGGDNSDTSGWFSDGCKLDFSCIYMATSYFHF